jgi:hypothetical protein
MPAATYGDGDQGNGLAPLTCEDEIRIMRAT